MNDRLKNSKLGRDRKYQSITYYQTKIIIMLTLALGIATSVYFSAKDYNRLSEEFENNVQQIINSIENSAANAVYSYNNLLAEEIVKGLFKFQPIISVSITDDAGTELAFGEKAPDEQTNTPKHDKILSLLFNLSPRTIERPLNHKNKQDSLLHIGTLHVVVTPVGYMDLFVDRVINQMLGALFITVVLTCVLIFLFQRLLAAPLIKLARGFSAFDPDQPDLNQMPVPEEFPNNEFRTVVENGVRMLEIIHNNVTELRRSHMELEDRVAERTASLQKLTQAIEQSPTMMFIVNRDTEIEYANAQFFSFTGFSKNEVIGQNPRILASGKTPGLVYEDLWRTIRGGKVWKHQIQDCKKDGTTYWASITIAPIHDSNQEITHYLCAQEDITQRVQAHQNLLQARDEAEKANRSKSEFLSNMSHELRTPLNAILGFAQLLQNSKQSPLNDKQQSQVDQILKGGNHLLDLINEVLELSKIEAGKLGMSVEPVQVDEIIEDCLLFASTLAEEKRITLKDSTDISKPVLMVDRLRTKQILMNLLSNAIKYNREGGSVWIYGEHLENAYYRISIVDTGFGIPEDRQVELFQPFSRLGAEASAIEGTGIGLALSKKLIEAMGGEIGFNCVQGRSTTFWCDFPQAKDDARKKSRGDELDTITPDTFASGQELLLLYVEDNPANLALMENVVDDISNITMISANTAELGLEMVQGNTPDIILMDINLPGMNGIEAVKHLRGQEKTRNTPIVALSANAMKETIDEALEAGFDEYLTKPLKIQRLYQILETLLPQDKNRVEP